MAVGVSTRNAKALGCFLYREASEIAEFDHRRGLRILLGQPGQSFVKSKDLVRIRSESGNKFIKFNASPATAMLGAFLSPGIVDKDVTHGISGRGEEMAAAFPALISWRGNTPTAH